LAITLGDLSVALEDRSLYGEDVVYNAPESREIALYEELEVKRYIRLYFPQEEWITAYNIVECESGFRKIQSQVKYSKDIPKWGVKAGDQELSFSYFQVHLPSNPKYDKDRLMTDTEYAIKAGYEIWQKQNWDAWKNCSNRPHIQELLRG